MTDLVQIPAFDTPRLTLRAPRMADVDAFAAFMASDRARYVSRPGISLRDSGRAFGHMAGLWVLRGYGPHVWCLKDGTPIGHGGAWFGHDFIEPELGWGLWSADYERQGYAFEAMQALRDWAIGGLRLDRLVAYVDPANTASVRLAIRLGGRHDPTARTPDDAPLAVFRFVPAVAA